MIENPWYIVTMCTEDDKLSKKINPRSIMWNYFGLKLDENRFTVCRTCNEAFQQRMEIPATCLCTYMITILIYIEATVREQQPGEQPLS